MYKIVSGRNVKGVRSLVVWNVISDEVRDVTSPILTTR